MWAFIPASANWIGAILVSLRAANRGAQLRGTGWPAVAASKAAK